MRMKDPSEKIGMQFSLTGTLGRIQVMWADRLVRMQESRRPKKAEAIKKTGHRRRDRPQLRWEDCVKRDVEQMEEDDKCG